MSLPLNQVICGDCINEMQKFPPDSIDLVVTSPPYWGLRDYGSETVRVWGGRPECEHEWAESESGLAHENRNFSRGSQEEVHGEKETTWIRKYDSQKAGFCLKCGAWRGSLGLEPHPQLFIDHLVEICRQIRRVLKPSGTFWLNLGDTYYGGASSRPQGKHERLGKILVTRKEGPNRARTESNWLQPKQKLMIPSRIAIALQHDGWILRNDLIWFKPNHMPSSVKDRLTCAYEHVFLFAKARRYYFDLDSIRQPHKVAKLRFPDRKIDYKHKDGPELRGLSGSASRQYFQTETATAWNPLGKNPADVWEVEEEKLTKHDIAVGRIGDFSYTDPLHTKEYPPKGKNPGDLWRIPTQPFKGAHFAVFPSALIEPIIKAGSPRWICSRCGKPRTRITERIGGKGGKNDSKKSISKHSTEETERALRSGFYRGKEFDTVTVRPKLPPKNELSIYLKNKKEESGLTTNEVATHLELLPELVAHWFRTDAFFNYPSSEDWKRLSSLLSLDRYKDEMTYIEERLAYDENAADETVGWSDCGCGEKWVGGIVLDPFGGSGTVGQVARRLGRRFILIEIIPEYCKMAEQRVRGKYKPVPDGVTPFDISRGE